MKSLHNFQAKKISNLNRIIGGKWVHTDCCVFAANGMNSRDIFYDTNGDGSCNTISEFQSMSYAK